MQQRIDEIMELVEEYHQARQHGTPECKITTRKAILEALGEFAADPAQTLPAGVPDAVRAALFAARGALQHLIEGGKPTESLFNAAIKAIDSVALTAANPAAVPTVETLPTWDELAERVDAGESLPPLEQFVYDNEEAGEGAEAWRRSVVEMVQHYASPAAPAPVVLPEPYMFCGYRIAPRFRIDQEPWKHTSLEHAKFMEHHAKRDDCGGPSDKVVEIELLFTEQQVRALLSALRDWAAHPQAGRRDHPAAWRGHGGLHREP